jgi:hypothetical protein
MIAIIKAYGARCVSFAEQVKLGVAKLEAGDSRARAQLLADCAELHEITNRLYGLLFKLGAVLPGVMDPVTLRYKAYAEAIDETESASAQGGSGKSGTNSSPSSPVDGHSSDSRESH